MKCIDLERIIGCNVVYCFLFGGIAIDSIRSFDLMQFVFLFRLWFEIIHCHDKNKKNNKELGAKNQLWFIVDIVFWFVAFWTTSDCEKFIFFRWVSSHFLMSSFVCSKKIKLQNNNVLNKSHFIFTIIFHRNLFWCILVVCSKMRIWHIW